MGGTQFEVGSEDGPRVQIGMPVYNGANFLAAAIESFLEQTYTDFELLISDNGSTDETQAIAEKYAAADPRVRYFRYEQNRGAAWNFNNAAKLATAEYFTWAAHDDLRHPEFLARCIPILDADPELICCYAATQAVDADGSPIGGYYADRCHRLESSPAARYGRSLGVYPMHVLFGVMRREPLMRTRLWGGYASADRVLVSELMLHGKVYELPEQLFLRRWHDNVSWIYGTSERDYAIWYDPSNAGKRFASQQLRRGVEYAKAIGHADLSAPQIPLAYAWYVWFVLRVHVAHPIIKRVKGARAPETQQAPSAG